MQINRSDFMKCSRRAMSHLSYTMLSIDSSSTTGRSSGAITNSSFTMMVKLKRKERSELLCLNCDLLVLCVNEVATSSFCLLRLRLMTEELQARNADLVEHAQKSHVEILARDNSLEKLDQSYKTLIPKLQDVLSYRKC